MGTGSAVATLRGELGYFSLSSSVCLETFKETRRGINESTTSCAKTGWFLGLTIIEEGSFKKFQSNGQ